MSSFSASTVAPRTFPPRTLLSIPPAISPIQAAVRSLPSPLMSSPRLKRRAVPSRATLRDLYTAGLVSVFRRDSVLRLWEPLRKS